MFKPQISPELQWDGGFYQCQKWQDHISEMNNNVQKCCSEKHKLKGKRKEEGSRSEKSKQGV